MFQSDKINTAAESALAHDVTDLAYIDFMLQIAGDVASQPL